MSRQMPVAGPAEVRAAAIRDLRADRGAVLGIVLVNGLASAAGLVGPWLLGRIIDTIQAGAGDVLGRVDRLAFGALVFTIVQTTLTWWALKIGYRFGERTAARVRERFLQRTLALPPRVADHLPTGDLIARGSTDASAGGHDIAVGRTRGSRCPRPRPVPHRRRCRPGSMARTVRARLPDRRRGGRALVLRRARPAYLAVAASGAELADVVASTAKAPVRSNCSGWNTAEHRPRKPPSLKPGPHA